MNSKWNEKLNPLQSGLLTMRGLADESVNE